MTKIILQAYAAAIPLQKLTTMKNIIVPVDFSKTSEFALKAGAEMAKKHNAKLHILHMLELSDSIITATSSSKTNEMLFMLKLAEKQFDEFLDKKYLKGVDYEAVVKQHKVYNEVDQVSNELDADLIIMGSHGKSIGNNWVTGSNAEKMVRHSATPVMILKEDPEDLKLKKVLFASDLSDESIPALNRALKLFEKLEAEVELVYVSTPERHFMSTWDFQDRKQKFYDETGLQQITSIQDYSIESGLINYAAHVEADIIATSTHARKGISHFLNGSISEDLANYSQLPVVTFRR